MEKFFKAASQEAVCYIEKETKIKIEVKIPFGTVACAWHRRGKNTFWHRGGTEPPVEHLNCGKIVKIWI